MNPVEALTLPLSNLPDPLPIPVIERPFAATIRPPGSKSLTNRALLLAALADGTSTLTSALVDADDALVMIEALRTLGAAITIDGTTITVRGVNGRWKPLTPDPVINIRGSGTAARFLTAAAVLAPPGTTITIDGDPRMRERPMGELIEALRQLGATVECVGRDGALPLRVHALNAPRPLDVSFGAPSSSQFISAMLMLGPFLPRGLTVRLAATPPSSSYIRMTERLMRTVGAHFDGNTPSLLQRWGHEATSLRIPRSRIAAFTLDIEPDFSSLSYFLAATVIAPGSPLRIGGPAPHQQQSLQGDAGFIQLLHFFAGVDEHADEYVAPYGLAPVSDFDLSDMPDVAMTAAALLCFAAPTPDNPTATSTLRGLHTLRHKESDRLAALQTELTKLGAAVEIRISPHDPRDVSLRLTPPPGLAALAASSPASCPRPSVPPCLPPITFNTYNDHRMAMSLALIGLRRPNVSIANPACVAKTYPTFWRDLATLYTSPA